LTGETNTGPRKMFVYFSDDGDVLALRYDNWKAVFLEQRCQDTLQVWADSGFADAQPEGARDTRIG
jgi:hypothetical protein